MPEVSLLAVEKEIRQNEENSRQEALITFYCTMHLDEVADPSCDE